MTSAAQVGATRPETEAPTPLQPPSQADPQQRLVEAARAMTALWLGPPRPGEEDLSQRFGETIDRSAHYMLSRFTLGLSPMAVAEAYFDWLIHLGMSPGKQLQLAEKAWRKSARLAHHMAHCLLHQNGLGPCIEPLEQDERFRGEAWQQWPYGVLYQSFLLQQQWWHVASTGVRGLGEKHEAQVTFANRQLLDVVSPSNFPLTNPEVLEATLAEGGANLVQGWWNFLEDWERTVNGRPPPGAEAYEVGRNLALTPGKVVYRNRLMELIRYEPRTKAVHPEPVLVVPAWIMKYYILDLTPETSLVRYLLDRGFSVYMISWKNPGYEDRDLGLEDYVRLGITEALAVLGDVAPGARVHATGYCLGGTLLAIAAAAMSRNGDDRLATLSFLAAQTDFEEAGELTLFITESQVSFLEDMMREQGYLHSHQMAGAFQMLRSNDLVWSRVVRDYLMGKRRPMNALMAWNADGTRMPARMHSEYLRQLFLKNDLAEGRLQVDGRPVALTDIRTPVFAVGTESDHVAPWRSAYKFHLLMDTSITFALTNGGHNGGIVSEPGHRGRHFRIRSKHEGDRYLDPDTWLAQTPATVGSWWPAWADWLVGHSGTATTRLLGAAMASLGEAPGSYVRQR